MFNYLVHAMVTIAAVESIMMACGLIGWRLLRAFRRDCPLTLETWLLGLGIGSSLMSYLIFGVMAARQFTQASLMVIGGLALMAGAWLLWRHRRELSCWGNRLDLLWPQIWWGVWLFLIMMAFNLLPALMPSVDWDGLAYHLALPKLYMQHHGFVFRPDIFHNLFPQFMEMLYSFGLLTPFGQAAKIIHFEFGVVSALAVFVLIRKISAHARWAMVGMLLFYMQYIVHMESGTSFIELGYTFFALLGMLTLMKVKQQPQENLWPLLAIMFFGITAAIKWHGAVILALGWLAIVFTLVLYRPSFKWRQDWWRPMLMGVVGLLPVVPYMVRNLTMAGNPVWPLAYHWFGGLNWDAGLAKQLVYLHNTYAGWKHGWSGLWRLPYDMWAHGEAFSVGAKEFKWPLSASVVLLGLLIFHKITKTGEQRPAISNWVEP